MIRRHTNSPTVALVGLIFLMGSLIYGCFWAGSKIAILESFKKLWPDPWFKLTMVDLYLGFGLVAILIGHREKSAVKTGLWVTALACLGNIATFLYLFIEILVASPGRRFLEPKRDTWRLF